MFENDPRKEEFNPRKNISESSRSKPSYLGVPTLGMQLSTWNCSKETTTRLVVNDFPPKCQPFPCYDPHPIGYATSLQFYPDIFLFSHLKGGPLSPKKQPEKNFPGIDTPLSEMYLSTQDGANSKIFDQFLEYVHYIFL